MTYRADEVGIALRIEALETEVAAMEGKRAGLQLGIAEAVERMRAAQSRWKKLVRTGNRTIIAIAGLLMGFLGGATCSGATFLVIPFACEGGITAELTGRPTEGSEDMLPDSQQCRVTVEGEAGDPGEGDDDDSGCRAEVVCGWDVIYRGRGGCGTYYSALDVLYWDSASSSEDGTPAVVISEHSNLAAIRDDGGRHLAIEVRDPDD